MLDPPLQPDMMCQQTASGYHPWSLWISATHAVHVTWHALSISYV